MKGGVGSICLTAAAGFQVGALVVVNALGNVVDWEQGRLLAGARSPLTNAISDFTNTIMPEPALQTDLGANTTLGVIVTDVELDTMLLAKMASAGQDGLMRAVRPAHTSLDGDTFFAFTTAQKPLPNGLPLSAPDAVVHLAGEAVRLAIQRAVRAARSVGSIPGLAGA
jgi:L-aminopeptidase/D-esterase-like protein